VRAALGLGSNLGDRWSLLADAVAELRELDSEALVSSVYETAPVGGPAGQGAYLNCVVVLETERSAADLLQIAHDLEARANRVRSERFGPRTLDVDVLIYGDEVSDDPVLTLPHPRMYTRAFVLAPLAEVAPDLVPADWTDSLGGAAAIALEVRRVGALLAPTPENLEQ
jgi:2-amino-4-hydroxy-6-hydroxymethyldihydropteridine diphosphokinase